MDDEQRCGSCGALVSAEAEWCGQCFASLREPDPPPPMPLMPSLDAPVGDAPAQSALSDLDAPTQEPFWPCTVCGAHNPIFLEMCETCGTAFAAVMRGTTRRDVDPQAARNRSLLFPGAGHTMLGYGIDGFARGALFVLSLGIALYLWITAPHIGPIVIAIMLMIGVAIGIYVLAAVETKQLAAGGQLIVPSKFLLWVAVGAMFLVVGAIAISVATSTRR